MEGKVNVLDYIYILVRRWKLIGLNFLIVCAVAAVISWILPEWYTGTAVILPPKEPEREFGFAGVLAELPIPRLRLGEKGTPSDIFIGILKSRRVADRMVDKFDLVSVYEVSRREEAIRALEGNTTVSKTDEGLIRVSVLDKDPIRCAEMANAYIGFLDDINQDLSIKWESDRRAFIEKQFVKADSTLKAAQDSLQSFQKKHNAISVEAQAEVAIKAAAELQKEIMGLNLQLQMLETSMAPTHAEIEYAKKRIGVRQKQLDLLRSGNTDNPGASNNNLFLPLEEIPRLQLDYLRRKMDVEVQGALVQFLRQKLEEKKIEATKEVPTVSIVDKAVPPEKRTKPRRRMIVMISGLFSLVFSLFAILGIEYFNALRRGEDSEKVERILDELKWRRKRDR